MRALMLNIASGRAEIDSIGQREGWSEGIKEEMMDRLQSMVRVALQRGDDLIMTSIPYSWRDRCTQRVRKASGIIGLIMPAVTINNWSFQDCQDYLGVLEMATSGAIMALRLTGKDIKSSQINLNSRAREARNMTFALRQRDLDVMLKNAGQSTWVYEDLGARRSGSKERAPGPSLPGPQGFDCPPVLRPAGRFEGVQEKLGRV